MELLKYVFLNSNWFVKLIIIIFFLIIGVFIVAIISEKFTKSGKEYKAKQDKKEDSIIKKYNLKSENIKSWLCFNFQSGVLFFTKDNKLVHLIMEDMKYLKADEIIFNKILSIQLEIEIKERNSMKVISLVPTFKNYKTINRVIMRIITEDRVYNLSLDRSPQSEYTLKKINFKNEHNGWSWDDIIDEANRLKLLIEKEINNGNKKGTI